MMYSIIYKFILFAGIISISITDCFAQDFSRVVRLKGYWLFDIGDSRNRSKVNYDDSDWEKIYVPSHWEDEGFYGYDGYAWYRTTFEISSKYKTSRLFLRLGYIDDVDEVYINGELIGSSGKFPSNYISAWQAERAYIIPENTIRFDGENVIAVRIYDEGGGGGIYAGDIGIYEMEYDVQLTRYLDGYWKFKPGDNLKWKESDYDDSNWDEIRVPARWDYQGYPDLDGFAWYRKHFAWNNTISSEKLVLLLGKIDDLDQTYLNGKLIGNTGDLIADPVRGFGQSYWQKPRGYLINKSDLKTSGDNVIAVRVYDGAYEGGMWEGPIGILSYHDYLEYIEDSNKGRKLYIGL